MPKTNNAFLEWARNTQAIREWQKGINLPQILGSRPNCRAQSRRERGAGVLVHIRDVFPQEVANAAAEIVESLPESQFLTLEGSGDPNVPAPDGIKSEHRFGAAMNLEENEGVQELFRILSGLMPPGTKRHSAFHIGRYEEGDHLGQQDDAAYALVDKGEGPVKCSRDIALMFFLSKGWEGDNGGVFHDLYHENPREEDKYVPEFNSMVAFHVPREFKVAPVLAQSPLLCAFGWFLQEGELYDLQAPVVAAAAEEADAAPMSMKSRKQREKERRVKERRRLARAAPAEVLELAREREEARRRKDFKKADRLREECRARGFTFNKGEQLVPLKMSEAGEGGEDGGNGGGRKGGEAEAKKKSGGKAEAGKLEKESGGGGGEKKKKRESKSERLKRQMEAEQEGGGEEGEKEEGEGTEAEEAAERGGKRGAEAGEGGGAAREREVERPSKRKKASSGAEAQEPRERRAVEAAKESGGEKKPPKRPKAKKKKSGGDVAQHGAKKESKGKQRLLQRIKSKGWLGGAAATS